MGKTGTTQDRRDSYLVGSTPGVTLAVWTGYDKENGLDDTGRYGRYYQRTQNMWSQIANNVYGVKPEIFASNARFNQPSSVTAKDFKDSGSFSEKKKVEEKEKEEEEKKKEEEKKREAEEAKEEAEEEAQQEAAANAAAKKKAEEEARAKAEAEAKKKAEEEAKKKAEEEAQQEAEPPAEENADSDGA
jgi:penicillin-binding protein